MSDAVAGPGLGPPSRGRAARVGSSRRVRAATSVLSVVLVVGAVALAYVIGGRPVRVEPGRAATLPAIFGDYSFLTGNETVSPLGRAVAVYDQATGNEDFTFTQRVVAGADIDAVREVKLRASTEPPVATLLRPDGMQLAMANVGEDEMSFLHLDTGDYSTLPTSGPAGAPLAWSPDGRYLAYLTGPSQPSDDGPLAILDTRDGTSVRTSWPKLQPGAPAIVAAFAPDGQQLAVQSGRELGMLDLHGVPRRRLTLPGNQDLAGPAAWSPDGSLLATVPWLGPTWDPDRKILFLDPRSTDSTGMDSTGRDSIGPDRPMPAPVDASHTRADSPTVLGWRTSAELLITEDEFNISADNLIIAVSLHTGARQRLSRFDASPSDSYPVQNLQLATGLTAGIGLRPGSDPDRGLWPIWLTLFFALALDLLVLFVIWRLIGVRGARPGRPPAPSRPAERENAGVDVAPVAP